MSLFFPTIRAIEEAALVQTRTMDDEDDRGRLYNSEEVARATVHARSDIILLVGLLKAQHSQLVNISRGIWLIAALLLLIVSIFSPN